MTQTKPAVGAGRPRDDRVDERALAATREVYAERGWFGTSYDEIAKRAGVGKSSLYLRWATKAELIVAALGDSTYIESIDTGTLRGDLLELASRFLDRQWTQDGAATFRFESERRYVEELREASAEVKYNDSVRAARRIVRRGIARGEVPAGTSPTMINDLIIGAIMTHVMVTPQRLTAAVKSRSAAYIVDLVDTVVAGVAAKR
jgi:AcrR family transcriptional regulator